MGAGEGRIAVVGAGVAGLSCARALADAGRPVTVLERARGVGGRCTTRRLEGVPLDMGAAFLHGRDAAFLAALESVPARRLEGWPAAVHGSGRPCQPEAFQPGERRLAYAEGVWATINAVNLRENIAPTRARADLLLPLRWPAVAMTIALSAGRAQARVMCRA